MSHPVDRSMDVRGQLEGILSQIDPRCADQVIRAFLEMPSEGSCRLDPERVQSQSPRDSHTRDLTIQLLLLAQNKSFEEAAVDLGYATGHEYVLARVAEVALPRLMQVDRSKEAPSWSYEREPVEIQQLLSVEKMLREVGAKFFGKLRGGFEQGVFPPNHPYQEWHQAWSTFLDCIERAPPHAEFHEDATLRRAQYRQLAFQYLQTLQEAVREEASASVFFLALPEVVNQCYTGWLERLWEINKGFQGGSGVELEPIALSVHRAAAFLRRELIRGLPSVQTLIERLKIDQGNVHTPALFNCSLNLPLALGLKESEVTTQPLQDVLDCQQLAGKPWREQVLEDFQQRYSSGCLQEHLVLSTRAWSPFKRSRVIEELREAYREGLQSRTAPKLDLGDQLRDFWLNIRKANRIEDSEQRRKVLQELRGAMEAYGCPTALIHTETRQEELIRALRNSSWFDGWMREREKSLPAKARLQGRKQISAEELASAPGAPPEIQALQAQLQQCLKDPSVEVGWDLQNRAHLEELCEHFHDHLIDYNVELLTRILQPSSSEERGLSPTAIVLLGAYAGLLHTEVSENSSPLSRLAHWLRSTADARLDPLYDAEALRERRERFEEPMVMALIREDPMLLGALPKVWRNCKRVVIEAVSRNGLALQFAPDYQDDLDVVIPAVNNCGLALRFASPALQADERAVRPAVRQDGLAISYAPQFWESVSMMADAVQQDGMAIYYALPNPAVEKPALREDVVEQDDMAIYGFPEKPAVEGEANWEDDTLQWDGKATSYAPPENQAVEPPTFLLSNPQLLFMAMQQNGLALQALPEPLCSIVMVAIEAVRQNGLALQFIGNDFFDEEMPQHKRLYDIAEVAVEQNGLALQFVMHFVEHLKPKQIYSLCEAAVRQNGLALQSVMTHAASLNLSKQQIKALTIHALRQNLAAMPYVPQSLLGNAEIQPFVQEYRKRMITPTATA